MNRNSVGFSLIEVAVALLLVAILAAWAMPTYRVPLLKMQQALAQTALYEAAIALEKHHETQDSYQLCSLKNVSCDNYTIALIESSKDHYKLAAIPKKEYPEDNCGTFYLDQDSNFSASKADCGNLK